MSVGGTDIRWAEVEGTLSAQQVAFFETFGFLRLPGLFADDVDGLTEGFEESFELDGAVHRGKRRLVILPFLERSRTLSDPEPIADRFGVEGDELPSYTVESTPGDVIALNFRTMHASFHGRPGRRLFTLNFRGVAP